MTLKTNNGTFECTVISVSQSGKEVSIVLPVAGKLSTTIGLFEDISYLEWEEGNETVHIEGTFSPKRVIRTDKLDSIGLEGVIA